MRLIVGLGNPGLRYRNTRHNVGFLALEHIAERLGCCFKGHRYKSAFCRVRYRDEDILLLRPKTYMNNSGLAVKEAVVKEGIGFEYIIVLCDDINLQLGTIRVRAKGSSGGHKGLHSVLENLGSIEVPRLRIGIRTSRFNQKDDITNYVLSNFSKSERDVLSLVIEKASDAVLCWIDEGISNCMNRFNKTFVS